MLVWLVRLVALAVVAAGCNRGAPAPTTMSSQPPTTSASVSQPASRPPCGDVVGAWSKAVDGLRGRLVTSGSRPDHSVLALALELENVSGHGPLDVYWTGRINAGFATFELTDEGGTPIAEPAWRFGGNEFTGDVRAIVPAAGLVHHVIGTNIIVASPTGRSMRIGAFWGRELPTDGSRRVLRARVTGGPAIDGAIAYQGNELARSAPRGLTWVGSLDVPGVCIE